MAAGQKTLSLVALSFCGTKYLLSSLVYYAVFRKAYKFPLSSAKYKHLGAFALAPSGPSASMAHV
jgi:hypothetical protein